MCMNNEFTAAPWNWAGEQAISENEAFENALKRITPQQTIEQLAEENASLRQQIRVMTEENRRLREALFREADDWYD